MRDSEQTHKKFINFRILQDPTDVDSYQECPYHWLLNPSKSATSSVNGAGAPFLRFPREVRKNPGIQLPLALRSNHHLCYHQVYCQKNISNQRGFDRGIEIKGERHCGTTVVTGYVWEELTLSMLSNMPSTLDKSVAPLCLTQRVSSATSDTRMTLQGTFLPRCSSPNPWNLWMLLLGKRDFTSGLKQRKYAMSGPNILNITK